jgi:hypothetical protein
MKIYYLLSLYAFLCAGCVSVPRPTLSTGKLPTIGYPASTALSMEDRYFSIGVARKHLSNVVVKAVQNLEHSDIPLQSVGALEVIDQTILSEGFSLKANDQLILFSESLNAGELDCFDRTLIYLEVAKCLGIDLRIVHAPRHILLAMPLGDEFVFWETLSGTSKTADYYTDTLEIHPDTLRKGTYLVPRQADTVFSAVCSKIGTKLNKGGRYSEAESLLLSGVAAPFSSVLTEYTLGVTYVREGKDAQARKVFVNVIRWDPAFEINVRILCGDISDWTEWND